MRLFRGLTFLGLAMGAALLAPQAQATVEVTQAAIDSDPGYLVGTVSFTGTQSMSAYAWVGRIAMSGTDQLGSATYWKSFCVDLFDELDTGTFAVQSISALNLSDTRTSQLEALASHADSYIVDATTSAAMQAAIWEVVNETASTFDVASGAFTITGMDQGAVNDANTILGYVTDGTWTTAANYGFAVLTADGKQTQLLYGAEATAALGNSTPLNATSAVPEPSSWAMMLLGFGALGLLFRRRESMRFAPGRPAA